MNKNESKYFNTAKRMDEALIALLERKDLEFITVKDICKAADVNRSTFYLHYETIQDLLSETLEYLDSQFHSYFTDSAEQVISGIPDAPLKNLIFVREKYLVPYLCYLRDHQTVFAVAIRQKRLLQSEERMKSLYRYIINPILQRFQVPEELRAYYNAFFMHGTLAVIQEWLNHGCKEEPEEVSRIIESLCIREKSISGPSDS